ncbi:MAG: tetratricopeptide repeat protein [Elusimicrobia bacterium]|nr:tetratricopeptide repeat protein [Elusimicrobiota bacterium]
MGLLACFIASSAGAFEFPLTRMQRVQKLVDEGYESLQRGDALRAAETCARAVELGGDYAPAYLCRGEARLRNGDPQAGLDALQALNLDPKSGDAYRVLGMLDFEAGRHAAAVRSFDQALSKSKLKPDEVSNVYYYRARAKLKLGDLDGALKDTERGMAVLVGIQGNYFDWSFYSLRAEIRRKQGKTSEADADERKVLHLLEDRMRSRPREASELLRLKAESHSLLRDFNAAANDYAALISKSTGDAAAQADRADALINAERLTEAEEELGRALLTEPGGPRALKLRGYVRVRLDRNADAVEDLDAAIEARPKDGVAYSYRAVAKLNLEDYEGGLSDILQAQELSPAEAGALDSRKAYALAMLSRHKEALPLAQGVLVKQPENYPANVARARSAAALGRCDEAARSLDWLIEKVPQSSEYLDLRAGCRCAARDFTLCLADSEKAAALEPGSRPLAMSLALRRRAYLDAFPAKADAAELLRSARLFGKASKLGRLGPDELPAFARTVLELFRQPASQGEERTRLLGEAKDACKSALKQRRKDRGLKDLCGRLRKLR